MSADMTHPSSDSPDRPEPALLDGIVAAGNLTDTMLVTKIEQLNAFRRGARETFRVGSLETFVRADQTGAVLVRPAEPDVPVDILDVAEALDRHLADRQSTGEFVVYETRSPCRMLPDGTIGVEVHDRLDDGTFVDGFRRVAPGTDEHAEILASGVLFQKPEQGS